MKPMIVVLLSCFLCVSQLADAADILTIAVASNVKYTFDDLASAFTKETGIEIKPIFSSSGKIVSQVNEGAPFDVFLSADMDFPQKLYKSGQAVTAPKVYAYGKLVIWVKSNQVNIKRGLSALAETSVKKVAIANPKVAPYGAQALNAIEQLGLKASIVPKLVYAENIAQVMQYVESGNVDAGITAKSLVTAPVMFGKGQWVDIPDNIYNPIAQGVVILRYGQANHENAARKFYDFLFSPKAREILKKFDYALP